MSMPCVSRPPANVATFERPPGPSPMAVSLCCGTARFNFWRTPLRGIVALQVQSSKATLVHAECLMDAMAKKPSRRFG